MKIERIAVLSNVNVNPIANLLKNDYIIYEAQGYGNEIETLMNKASALYEFKPQAVIMIEDLMETVRHNFDLDSVKKAVYNWFHAFEACISFDCIYMVSDGYLYGEETRINVVNEMKGNIEKIWKDRLKECQSEYANVYVFPLHRIIECMGEEKVFSRLMWYMGKIPYSLDAQKRIADEINRQITMHKYGQKKVLVLDLDNTIWGGLAGENDKNPIQLSDDGKGLAYKNLQRVVKIMKDSGVILCIASKNNEDDAMQIIEHHPHMVLRPDDFTIKKINWDSKPANIVEIAEELNLGLDTVVFFDDSPQERELAKEMLPDVTIPDFPRDTARLPEVMSEIYRTCFEKPVLTNEDKQKTKQYATNVLRNDFMNKTGSFQEFLKGLDIVVKLVDPVQSIERLVQLANKTNQFNVTTKRYTLPQMQEMVLDDKMKIYPFRVADRFGDTGIVAIVVVDLHDEIPVITEFAMSCRVMGRNIEFGIIDYIENDIQKQGYDKLESEYMPTTKNKPVKDLWIKLGYRIVENGDSCYKYEINLFDKPKREYYFAKSIGGA